MKSKSKDKWIFKEYAHICVDGLNIHIVRELNSVEKIPKKKNIRD